MRGKEESLNIFQIINIEWLMPVPSEYVLFLLFILTILCSNNFITSDLVAQGNTTGFPAKEITSINGGASVTNESYLSNFTQQSGQEELNKNVSLTSQSITEQNQSTKTPTVTATVILNILQGASVQGNPPCAPNPLTIKKGDPVVVANIDTAPHTVTSGTGPQDPNSAKLFDTGVIDAAGSVQIETSNIEVGAYPFYCNVHPYMTGIMNIVSEMDSSNVIKQQLPPTSTNPVTLLSQNTYVDSTGTLHIVGEVQNISNESVEFVRVIATLYNAYNQVVGTSLAYTAPSDLAPDQRAPFNIWAPVLPDTAYYGLYIDTS